MVNTIALWVGYAAFAGAAAWLVLLHLRILAAIVGELRYCHDMTRFGHHVGLTLHPRYHFALPLLALNRNLKFPLNCVSGFRVGQVIVGFIYYRDFSNPPADPSEE